MLTTLFNYEWDYWTTVKKVTFDGDKRLIIVNEGVTDLDIRKDVYSRWIDWRNLPGNMAFTEAMRFTGLDVIPGGYTGDSYFLINGWKLLYDPSLVNVFGVLYSDDYDTPYYTYSQSPVYPAKVAALVSTSTITNNVPALSAEDIATIVSAIWDAKMENFLISAGSFGQHLSTVATKTDTQAISDKVDEVPSSVWNHTQ